MTIWKPLLVRFPPALHEAVRAAAASEGISMAEYVRRALCREIERAPKETTG